MNATVLHGDSLEWSQRFADDSVDMVFCSPPYEKARTYGIDFSLSGQAWVDWAVERFVDQVRICRGLVAWVVEGQTKEFRWSAAPALMMADLHRRGIRLRKPPIFHRVGIPGSGGPDWLRNDYEFIVCASKGKLPWSDNTAMGHTPKYAPGGAMSNRHADGRRINSQCFRHRDDFGFTPHDGEPSQTQRANGARRTKIQSRRRPNGTRPRDGAYAIPVKANPGNVLKCIVGGGVMGSKLAHENEAPFPESLVEFYVRSFCPLDGTVADFFCGSGTTGAVALKHGRRFIGVDIRESQVELTNRRLAEVTV